MRVVREESPTKMSNLATDCDAPHAAVKKSDRSQVQKGAAFT